MARQLLALCLAMTMAAHGWAGGTKTGNTTATASVESTVVAVNDASAQALAMSEGGAGGTATAVSGDPTATASTGPSASTSEVGPISVVHKQVRQAPSVGLVPGQSTAPFLKCAGVGGSDEKGSAVIGWCWLQRDTYAKHRAETLAALDLPLPAATAYCSRRLHWQDFGSRDACESSIAQSLIDRRVPEMVDVMVPVDCSETDEKLRRCETLTGMK